MDQMTPFQQEQIRLGMQFLDIQQQQIAKENEQLAVVEARIQERQGELAAEARFEEATQRTIQTNVLGANGLPVTLTEDIPSTLSKLESQIEAFKAKFKNIKLDIEIGNTNNPEDVFNSLANSYKLVVQQSKNLVGMSGQVQAALNATAEGAQIDEAALEKVRQVLLSSGIVDQEWINAQRQKSDQSEILREKLEALQTQIQQSAEAVRAMGEMMKLMLPEDQHGQIDALIRDFETLANGTIQVNKHITELGENVNKLNNMTPKLAPKDWTDNVLALGRAFTSVSMAIQSIKNIGEIVTERDISGVELITKLSTSLVMVAPVIKGAVSGISAFTAAMKAGTLATGGMAAAVNTLIWPLALLALAIGAVVTIVDIYNKQGERARERINEDVSAYKEEAEKLDSLNDELKTSQERLKELEAIESPTFIEQQEIEKLKEANGELETLIDKEERRAAIHGRAAARTIEADIGKATAFLNTMPATRDSDGKNWLREQWNHILIEEYNSEVTDSTQAFQDYKDRVIAALDDITVTYEEARSIIAAGLLPDSNTVALMNYYAAIEDDDYKDALEDWVIANQEAFDTLESTYTTYLDLVQRGFVTGAEFIAIVVVTS